MFEETKFYAARPDDSGPAVVCLVANTSAEQSWWPQACGDSPFSMIVGSLSVRLFPNGVEKEIPAGWEKVGDFLWVRED